MQFGMITGVGPMKHVLDGGAHWRNLANTTEPPWTKITQPIEMPFGLWTRVRQRKYVTWGGTFVQPGEYD